MPDPSPNRPPAVRPHEPGEEPDAGPVQERTPGPAEEPAPGPIRERGWCFGFHVRSPLELSLLRPGPGEGMSTELVEAVLPDPDDLGQPLQRWDAVPDRRIGTRLFRDGDGYLVSFGGPYTFRIAVGQAGSGPGSDVAAGRITVAPAPSLEDREVLLWTTPAAVAIALQGDLALHAASVEVNGKGLLITGDSGAGKTTTAAGFHLAGHRILSDDLSRCRLTDEPVVFPGPAVLRLRPDAGRRLFPEGLRNLDGAKPRLVIPGKRRGEGSPVPLRGIVFLRRTEGETTVRRVPPEEALRRLWPANFHLPGEVEQARCFRLTGRLVGRVPAWELSRPMDWDSLPATVERIAEALPG